MKKNSKILITGATGMVGSNLYKKLLSLGYKKIIAPGINRRKYDLKSESEVFELFNEEKPEYVFMIAARVGGIQANINDPVWFLSDNLKINLNLFKCCYMFGIKKSLYLGSSCIYPKDCKQPMKEEDLLSGLLEPTNEGYALSKIVGLKLAEYYYKQYGMKTICLMPPNLYYESKIANENSHVFESLIKKICDAKINNLSEITIWGDGTARREFMNVDDLCSAILYFFNKYETPDIINVGTGIDYTIAELVSMICKEVDYDGSIYWDITKPNGMKQKLMDVSKMKKLGFKPKINIHEGIKKSVKYYKEKSQ